MTEETVFIIPNPSGGSQGRMHTDKDCARLKTSTKPTLEKPKSVVESHRIMCKWCSGEARPGSSTPPMERRDMLLDMDPDEVFG